MRGQRPTGEFVKNLKNRPRDRRIISPHNTSSAAAVMAVITVSGDRLVKRHNYFRG